MNNRTIESVSFMRRQKKDKKYILLQQYSKIFFLSIVSVIILFSALNTIYCADDSTRKSRSIAVMIGNSPAERIHQKGLTQAAVIYEIEVEFPFTRYMAFFLDDRETIIGPVRSSRYYFSRICAEWSAIFAHCGGQNLKNAKILDMDEIHHPFSFWRDAKIGGWINLFANTATLKKEAEKQNKISMNKQWYHPLLNYSQPMASDNGQIHKMTIKYHQDYIVSYEYQPDEKKYYRYINQKPHYDRGYGEQIKVSNIVLQQTAIEKITGDELDRVQVKLTGEGIGNLFMAGNCQSIRWIKRKNDDRTQFVDSTGNPLSFLPGMTWVHLLSPRSEVWFK